LLNNTSNRYVPSLKEVDNNFKEVIKAEFTDNLFIDLKNDHDAMMSVVSYHAIVRQYAMSAVDALNGANSVNDEQFVISAYQASQINPPWSNRATYNEMLSTGQINLIKYERRKF
jgi:hypothetical protein